MYSFSKLRHQVDSLMRKYAVELTVYRTRPIVEEYCDQWEQLATEEKLPPDPRGLLKKLLSNDFLRRRLPAVNNYLDACRRGRYLPHTNEILHYLVPQAVDRGIIPKRPGHDLSY